MKRRRSEEMVATALERRSTRSSVSGLSKSSRCNGRRRRPSAAAKCTRKCSMSAWKRPFGNGIRTFALPSTKPEGGLTTRFFMLSGFLEHRNESPVKPFVQPRKCRLRFGTGVSCNEVHIIFEIATSSAYCPALGAVANLRPSHIRSVPLEEAEQIAADLRAFDRRRCWTLQIKGGGDTRAGGLFNPGRSLEPRIDLLRPGQGI